MLQILFAKQIHASIKVICQYWGEKDITKTEASVPLIKSSFHQLYRTGKVQSSYHRLLKSTPSLLRRRDGLTVQHHYKSSVAVCQPLHDGHNFRQTNRWKLLLPFYESKDNLTYKFYCNSKFFGSSISASSMQNQALQLLYTVGSVFFIWIVQLSSVRVLTSVTAIQWEYGWQNQTFSLCGVQHPLLFTLINYITTHFQEEMQFSLAITQQLTVKG